MREGGGGGCTHTPPTLSACRPHLASLTPTLYISPGTRAATQTVRLSVCLYASLTSACRSYLLIRSKLTDPPFVQRSLSNYASYYNTTKL